MEVNEDIVFIGKKINFKNKNNFITFFKIIGIEQAEYIDDDNVEILTGGYKNKLLSRIDVENDSQLFFFDLNFNFLNMFEGSLMENFASLILGNNYYFYEKENNIFNLIANVKENEEILNICKMLFEEEVKTEVNIEKAYINISHKIISQDKQIRTILSTINRNQDLINKGYSNDKIREMKQSILVIGKTGTGKTAIIKEIAKEFDLIVDIENAKDFTENGYVGKSIEDIFKNLYSLANGDIKKAENGILIIDEFDKLSYADDDKGISTMSVQKNLLSLIEGFKYYVTNKDTDQNNFYFDTSKLTVIVCGAFENIDEIIKKRLNITRTIGYNNAVVDNSTIIPNEEDIINYGFLRELIGRLEKVVVMNDLNKKDFRKILLLSKNSPLLNEQEYYESKNTKLSWNSEFIEEICEKAEKSRLGARALKKLISEYIGERQFKVENGTIKTVTLTSKNKQKTLKMNVNN